MAEDERKKLTRGPIPNRTVLEPWVALRRVQGVFLALVLIATAGVLGYMAFED